LTEDRLLRVLGSRPPLLAPLGTEYDVGAEGLRRLDTASGVARDETARLPSPVSAAFVAAGMRHSAIAALRDGSEIIGTFSVARKRDEPYSDDDLEFIRQLGTMLGQSMASYRRTERVRAEATRNHLLTEVALLVNAGQPADRFFDQLRELLAPAIPFDSMALLVPHMDGLNLRVVGSLQARTFKVGALVPIEAVIGAPPTTDGNYVVEYVPGDLPSPVGQFVAESGVHRLAVAVLRQGSQLLGVLSLGRDREHNFLSSELELLRLLAAFLGQSLANEGRLSQAHIESARRLLLSEVAVLLNDGKPTADVFARVAELMRPILPWDRCALLLLDGRGREFVTVASLPGDAAPVGSVIPVSRLASPPEDWGARPSVVFRPEEIPLDVTQRMASIGSVFAAATALREGDRVLGLFTVGRDSETPFSTDDLSLLEFLATLLARSLAAEQRIAASRAEVARASLLNELGLLLNAGENVEALFDRLPQMLGRAIAFDYVGVAVEAGRPDLLKAVDWNSRSPVNSAPRWVHRESVQLDSIPVGSGNVFQFHVQPEMAAEGTSVAEFAREGVRRSAVVLLGTAERRLGILHLARRNPERFQDEEMAFLEVVGTFFSQAVGNQLRLAESAMEADEQRLIADVAAVAAAATTSGALAGALHRPLRRLIARPFAAFGYLDGEEVVYPYPDGSTVRVPLDRPSIAALKRGQVSSPDLPSQITSDSTLRTAHVRALTHTVARSGGLVIGFLLVGSRQEGFVFQERELRILRIVAQIAGPAMENVRAAERSRLESDEQRLLAEIATVAAVETSAVHILLSLVAPLEALVSSPLIGYGHIQGETVAYPLPGGKEVLMPLTAFEIAACDRGLGVGPVADYPAGHPAHRFGGIEVCLVAYQAGGAAAGLLAVSSRDPQFHFGEREQRILRLVGQIVGPAMENARAVERARIEAEEQRILAEAASAAARGTTIAGIVGALPAALASIVPGAFVFYGRLADETIIYDTVTPGLAEISGGDELQLPLSAIGLAARSAGYGQGSLTWAHSDSMPPDWRDGADPRVDAMRRIARAFGLHKYALLSYQAAGAPVGMLFAATTDPEHVFLPAHISLLARVAQIVGPAIEAVRAATDIARQGALYHLILRSLTEGVILLDADGNPVFANGFGTTFYDAVSPDGAPGSLDEFIARSPESARADMKHSLAEGV
ncbi:MAG: GAF domain-containing protein, partial [Tepidiformaceae bacterium]